MKAKVGVRDIISMTLLALMTVLVIFASAYTSSKKNAVDAVQEIERDKVDCTILPSPRGKNPFAGKSFELRNESSLRRFDFAEDGELYLIQPCVLDKRLSLSLESKCDYTWDADAQELFVKPVAFKIDGNYSSYSIQLKKHYAGQALELLDNLPYPWYSEQDRSTAESLLLDYFSILIDKKLFEVENFGYDVQDYGLMLEEKDLEIFDDAVAFSLEKGQDEYTLKVSDTQVSLSCPDDDSGNSVFYAGIPRFDGSGKICDANLCRMYYEDSIQIESGSKIRLEFLPQKTDDGNGMVFLEARVLDIPGESGIVDGEVMSATVRGTRDLLWYNASPAN